jgi:menaquinone-9 beta-reductase
VLAYAIRSPAIAEAGVAASATSPALFDVLVELGLGQARITPRLLAALPGGLLRAKRASPFTRGTG